MKKLYIIVREDLDQGLLTAQACHAAAKFCLEHRELALDWGDDCNLIVLSVPSKEKLAELLYKLELRGVKTSWFREPDVGGELTAIACREGARPLVSCLPCALRPKVEGLPRRNRGVLDEPAPKLHHAS